MQQKQHYVPRIKPLFFFPGFFPLEQYGDFHFPKGYLDLAGQSTAQERSRTFGSPHCSALEFGHQVESPNVILAAGGFMLFFQEKPRFVFWLA